MNNNSINFQTPRTRLGTICELSCGIMLLLSLALSFVVLNNNPEAGKAMIMQSFITACSVALVLFFAYLPHTFNIPDDSPAEAFWATIRLLRIVALLSSALSLGITLTALFGAKPDVLVAAFIIVIVAALVWYLLKMRSCKAGKTNMQG